MTGVKASAFPAVFNRQTLEPGNSADARVVIILLVMRLLMMYRLYSAQRIFLECQLFAGNRPLMVISIMRFVSTKLRNPECGVCRFKTNN